MKSKTKPSIKPCEYTVSFKKGKKNIELNVTNTKLTDWIDKQDLKHALHFSDSTLQTLRASKRIPYSHIGGKFYYFLPGILALLEENLH